MNRNENVLQNGLIRTMVRGSYDLQTLRIQFGNRITGNFKSKLGQKPGMSEQELEKQEKTLLEKLRKSYLRITDGIVDSIDTDSDEPEQLGKLPSAKKFKGDELITNYTELVLVHQYLTLVNDEKAHFSRLKDVLKGIPIYDTFLTNVKGVGPAIAGIIISEIDITKAEYPSSLAKYAGLDVVIVGRYTDAEGKEKFVPQTSIELFYAENSADAVMMAEGKYPVSIGGIGRSRRDFCLEDREYEKKDGTKAMRRSITFNPFLKTKLIGVLGTSFLRTGTSIVDGKKCGVAKRYEMAVKEGFNPDGHNEDLMDEIVCEYLRGQGHEVIVEPSHYGQIYYNYRNRLDNSPHHDEKTDAHKHNMAIRYAVKQFLYDLYDAWRKLEGLPVSLPYAEAKLGLVHGKAGYGKPVKEFA